MLTPERIQELKGRYADLSPEDITFMTVGELTSLLAALEEAQQQLVNIQHTLFAERARGDKWEKAFDNADRQYLKQEKTAADLRRELTKFQTLASDNHTLAARFERELAEAQQTIARLTAALIAERDAALIWDGIGTVNRINEALGEGAKES